MNRKEVFANGEIYHIYNRGVDKRKIIMDFSDLSRFMSSFALMNRIEPIESMREPRDSDSSPLVEILAYCILDNHFHFILKQISDDGISKFMHRIGSGYTNYFNIKHDRSGSLFQGKFKARHVTDQNYFTHLVSYVHANYVVHQFVGWKKRPESQQYIISSLWEQTPSNPFVLCKSLLNPEGQNRKQFTQWCEKHALAIHNERNNKKAPDWTMD